MATGGALHILEGESHELHGTSRKALNHEEADRVPNYPIIAGCARRLIDCSYPDWSVNADLCAESHIKAQEEFDLDCIVTLIGLSVECTAWGQELVYPENEAAHPNYDNQLSQDIDDYEKIKYVDYHTCDRMMRHVDTVKKLIENFGDEVPVVAFVFGPLGTLSMMRKQEETYMDIYDEPEAVKAAAACMIHNCGGKIYFDRQIERMHSEAISFLYRPMTARTSRSARIKTATRPRSSVLSTRRMRCSAAMRTGLPSARRASTTWRRAAASCSRRAASTRLTPTSSASISCKSWQRPTVPTRSRMFAGCSCAKQTVQALYVRHGREASQI